MFSVEESTLFAPGELMPRAVVSLVMSYALLTFRRYGGRVQPS